MQFSAMRRSRCVVFTQSTSCDRIFGESENWCDRFRNIVISLL
ncbi:MAG: hypothetical protein V7K90_01450 [Nostoc sp.]